MLIFNILDVRKRLVIGAIAAMVIGVAAYLLSQPKGRTVQWHVNALKKDQRSIEQRNRLITRAPSFIRNLMLRRQAVRMKRHRDALVRMGFLQRADVIVSSVSPDDVMNKALGDAVINSRVDWVFFGWDSGPTNAVR